MNEKSREGQEINQATSPEPAGYEPPRIESAFTARDLDREVLYAGRISQIP